MINLYCKRSSPNYRPKTQVPRDCCMTHYFLAFTPPPSVTYLQLQKLFPALCFSPVRNNERYLLIHNKFFPIWRTHRCDIQLTLEAFFNNGNYVHPHCTTPNTTFEHLTIPPVTTEYDKAFEFYCVVNQLELTRICMPSNITKVSHSNCSFLALWLVLQTLSVPTQTLFYYNAFYS